MTKLYLIRDRLDPTWFSLYTRSEVSGAYTEQARLLEDSIGDIFGDVAYRVVKHMIEDDFRVVKCTMEFA